MLVVVLEKTVEWKKIRESYVGNIRGCIITSTEEDRSSTTKGTRVG